MRDGRKTLKEQNANTLRWFLAAIIILYFGLLGTSNWQRWLSPAQVNGSAVNATDVISLAALFTYLLVANLVPTEWKEILVFWRVRERLPGHRAFSFYATRDERVDIEQLKLRVPDWPATTERENRAWYKLYLEHAAEPQVTDPHRRYLLYRELTYLTAATGLVLLLPAAIFAAVPVGRIGIALVCVVAMTVVFGVNAQNNAIRLVQNVLAMATRSAS